MCGVINDMASRSIRIAYKIESPWILIAELRHQGSSKHFSLTQKRMENISPLRKSRKDILHLFLLNMHEQLKGPVSSNAHDISPPIYRT